MKESGFFWQMFSECGKVSASRVNMFFMGLCGVVLAAVGGFLKNQELTQAGIWLAGIGAGAKSVSDGMKKVNTPKEM